MIWRGRGWPDAHDPPTRCAVRARGTRHVAGSTPTPVHGETTSCLVRGKEAQAKQETPEAEGTPETASGDPARLTITSGSSRAFSRVSPGELPTTSIVNPLLSLMFGWGPACRNRLPPVLIGNVFSTTQVSMASSRSMIFLLRRRAFHSEERRPQVSLFVQSKLAHGVDHLFRRGSWALLHDCYTAIL